MNDDDDDHVEANEIPSRRRNELKWHEIWHGKNNKKKHILERDITSEKKTVFMCVSV